jgi:hypothetical protein
MKRFEACVNHILLYCSKVWSLPQLIKGRDITNFEFNYEKFVPNEYRLLRMQNIALQAFLDK